KSAPKAFQKREHRLSSFDVLCRDLRNAFTALAVLSACTTEPCHSRRAYLAIFVGPSIGSAKAKVMLRVDGMLSI
ncbi:hypothetical protein R3P38DRAFT_2577461, partial [Favolaschia claudopus]